MNRLYEQNLVSPLTHQPLVYGIDGRLSSGVESYEVVENIPILLPSGTVADWRRELIDLILWEHPDQIGNLYGDADLIPGCDPAQIYIKWIKKLIGGKEDIIGVLKRYETTDTQRWIVDRNNKIDADSIETFHRLCAPEIGKRRVESSHRGGKNGSLYTLFSKLTTENHPKKILELATGAGTGAASIALKKDADTLMFSIDIDFACLGNVIGIGSYLNCLDTLLPVDANFWFLPFSDGQMDAVCTVCGLDESRENDKTIAEVARVLKSGGRFVCVSRENAFMRQGSVLEPFGFSEEEVKLWLKRCRMYSDVETLKGLCAESGLHHVHEHQMHMDSGVVFVTSVFEKT